MLSKKDQVVRARLNRITEATNMAAEEFRSAFDRYIARVASPNGRDLTTDKDICREFCDYF